jgi:tRNA pseudouridine55 synthase
MEQPEAAIDGVLVINKPVGPTSHDIVACARRAFSISRVGHTGTLDPNASGVLPLVLGRATRLAQYLSGREKEYLATVRFGRSTDTYDALGTVVTDDGPIPSRAEIETALEAFRGAFDQMPPPHSAKKVDGVRAYKRARAAVPVALRPARVTVTRLDLLDMDGAEVRLQVACSAGFYVRSLAHDLGTALGTGALLQALTRTRSGVFGLEGSVDLATLAQQPDVALTAVHSMDEMLPEIPAVHLTADGARKARHGQALGPTDMVRRLPGGFDDGAEATRENGADATKRETVRLLGPDGHLLGLARPGDVAGTLHPSVIVG